MRCQRQASSQTTQGETEATRLAIFSSIRQARSQALLVRRWVRARRLALKTVRLAGSLYFKPVTIFVPSLALLNHCLLPLPQVTFYSLAIADSFRSEAKSDMLKVLVRPSIADMCKASPPPARVPKERKQSDSVAAAWSHCKHLLK